MHEMAVTQSMLDMAVVKAREVRATAITRINLVIGDMSSVLDESVQFYFNFVSKGTLAEGAQLVFQRIAIQARCRKCGAEFQPGADHWQCPGCGDTGVEIIAGSEFYMDSIEVEG
jgi:hydrogenase nickel incorporation protein HypA/HybF